MKRSLQRHLSLMLGGAVLLAGLLAALASFLLAYSEAREFQDDMLRQIATLAPLDTAAGQLRPSTDLDDPESRLLVLHLPHDLRPEWLASGLRPGFHTLDANAGRLRVYLRDSAAGGRTVVAQATETRDELAINSALRTLIPLLLLLPVLAWLIVHIVRGELAPIARLSRTLDEQPVDRPQAIADSLPEEISPFVHAINRLLERVKLGMEQQRRFVADAAHELRGPLTALSLQARNLSQAATPEAMRERVAPLQEGIERARHLTEQLLSLARTQAGGNGEAEIDVAALARELIAESLPHAEARDIDLGLDEWVALTLRGNPDALRLIVKNALENALKFSPEGGVVTVRLVSEDGAGVIEIVDSGPGIPPEAREQVFAAFHRLPGGGEGSGEGSGLGLAIAREAATRLGGSIHLETNPSGRGLLFQYRHPPDWVELR